MMGAGPWGQRSRCGKKLHPLLSSRHTQITRHEKSTPLRTACTTRLVPQMLLTEARGSKDWESFAAAAECSNCAGHEDDHSRGTAEHHTRPISSQERRCLVQKFPKLSKVWASVAIAIFTAAIPEEAKHSKAHCCRSSVVGASWSPCVVSCALAARAWVGTHIETKLVSPTVGYQLRYLAGWLRARNGVGLKYVVSSTGFRSRGGTSAVFQKFIPSARCRPDLPELALGPCCRCL